MKDKSHKLPPFRLKDKVSRGLRIKSVKLILKLPLFSRFILLWNLMDLLIPKIRMKMTKFKKLYKISTNKFGITISNALLITIKHGLIFLLYSTSSARLEPKCPCQSKLSDLLRQVYGPHIAISIFSSSQREIRASTSKLPSAKSIIT